MLDMPLPKDEQAAADLGERLTAATVRAGLRPAELYRRMMRETRYVLPTTDQTLRNMLAGKVNPHSADVLMLGALLKVLDLPDDGLGPVVAERMSVAHDLIGIGGGRTQPQRATRRYKGPPKVRSHPVAA